MKESHFYFYEAGSPKDGYSWGVGLIVPEALLCHNKGRGRLIPMSNITVHKITFNPKTLVVTGIEYYGKPVNDLGERFDYPVEVNRRIIPPLLERLGISYPQAWDMQWHDHAYDIKKRDDFPS